MTKFLLSYLALILFIGCAGIVAADPPPPPPYPDHPPFIGPGPNNDYYWDADCECWMLTDYPGVSLQDFMIGDWWMIDPEGYDWEGEAGGGSGDSPPDD